MTARDSNAMSNLQYRLLGGEQVLPLIGAEQTTSSLVVMIFLECPFNVHWMTIPGQLQKWSSIVSYIQ